LHCSSLSRNPEFLHDGSERAGIDDNDDPGDDGGSNRGDDHDNGAFLPRLLSREAIRTKKDTLRRVLFLLGAWGGSAFPMTLKVSCSAAYMPTNALGTTHSTLPSDRGHETLRRLSRFFGYFCFFFRLAHYWRNRLQFFAVAQIH
jgi:hypothetical protein